VEADFPESPSGGGGATGSPPEGKSSFPKAGSGEGEQKNLELPPDAYSETE
jgi:hypothetical protein